MSTGGERPDSRAFGFEPIAVGWRASGLRFGVLVAVAAYLLGHFVMA